MANMKEVWTAVSRGEGKKDFWLRVGTAFENKDSSWSIVLDALPVNGKLIMRDKREWDNDEPPRRQAPSGGGGSRRASPDDDIPFIRMAKDDEP